MASAYDKASLVMLPHAVKEDKLYSVKPEDRSGDFTFSRGSDIQATRVNSSGLIEKAKENLFIRSNTFNTGWSPVSGTFSQGVTDPFGGNTAWSLTATNTDPYLYQNPSVTGVVTLSMWVKGVGSSIGKDFVLVGNGASPSTQTRTLTGDWVRVEAFFNLTTISTIGFEIPNPAVTGDVVHIYGAQLNHGLVATDYIETTTTAVVEGLTADLPRLDYSGGASCPSLLLEPQRTNYARSSEYYNTSANWILSGVSVEDNFTISPEGVQNASKVTINSGANFAAIGLRYLGLTTGDVTISCWAKADSEISVGFNDGVYNPNKMDLTTEWQRFEFTFSYTANDPINLQIDNYFGVSPDSQEKVFYLWGCQAEQGSYPTSYIPTYGTAAVRGADSASKTGISSLIGQTEGTLFLDFNSISDSLTSALLSISDASVNNRITILKTSGGNLRVILTGSGTQELDESITAPSGNAKIAISYKSGDNTLYLNGVQQWSTADTFTFGTISRFAFNDYDGDPFTNNPIKQALVFKTRLTNAELASLTTI